MHSVTGIVVGSMLMTIFALLFDWARKWISLRSHHVMRKFESAIYKILRVTYIIFYIIFIFRKWLFWQSLCYLIFFRANILAMQDKISSLMWHVMSRVILGLYLLNGEISAWWRHPMETFSALLALCAGNSPVPGEFPAQRPVTRNFDVSLIEKAVT